MSAPRVSKRMGRIAESVTLKLNALVKTLQSQGVDVINLTAGEPDFNVPDAAKQAVIEAVNTNQSKYTPVAGIPELRKLIADKTNKQQPSIRRAWSAQDVVVTNGGKQALFNALMAILDPGDEVVIPSPYWLSYPEMVRIAQGEPRFIESSFESGYKITPAQLKRALTKKTKAFVINSPSNPTGAMYSPQELAELGKIFLEPAAQGIWVISDEIYDRMTYGQVPFASFLECVPQLQDRCITLNALSKSAAMTGWRVGWSVAEPGVTRAMETLQGQSTSGINSLAQWAGVAALKIPESAFDSHVMKLREKRDLVLDILGKNGKIKVYEPLGAFYAFVEVQEYFRAGEDSVGFAERLLQEARVAVVPGTPFGAPGAVRLSFATDEKKIQEGCVRFANYLTSHSEPRGGARGRV